MKVLIAQNEMELERVRVRDKKKSFDLSIVNEPNSAMRLEGFRVTEVFLTAQVLTQGLDIVLYAIIEPTLVRMGVDPMYAYRIFYV